MAKKLTPMMEQYYELKELYPKEILFFRLGDFYEMFYDDALVASRELELTLTGRAAGNNERAPMCGVPFHSAENYIYRLLQKGYRVAICEQLEDPKEVKGLVKRGVVKVITPGTVLAENFLPERQRNYVGYLLEGAKEVALCLAEVSTGECRWGSFAKAEPAELWDALSIYRPSELILEVGAELAEQLRAYSHARLGSTLLTHVEELGGEGLAVRSELPASLQQAWLAEYPLVKTCLQSLLAFVAEMLKSPASHFSLLLPLQEESQMHLDHDCLRHLEVNHNLRDGGKKGTVFELLDRTCTAMGGRMLSRWLEAPLTDVNAITLRQDALSDFLQHNLQKDNLRDELSSIFDFERILTRVEVNSASPKDLLALRDSLAKLQPLKEIVGSFAAPLLKHLHQQIGLHGEVLDLLQRGIADTAGLQRDGNYIKEGYSAQLDELRMLVRDNREWIRRLEESEKEKTGMKLKIGFNNVFGYYFEVPHSNTKEIPAYFVRKQTLANAERYITPELKEFEVKVLHAQESIEKLEATLFREIKDKIRPYIVDMQQTARIIAEIDCLAALAETAFKHRYVRPMLNTGRRICIRDGRHPVLDATMQEVFVPNDTMLSHEDCEAMLITGPNMAGKSTYMRQVAVLMIMAQVGSFLPVREADICPVERIFTRIGASDDISTGQSTFMVEMKEVAHILRHATENSLILLDEIGRGTSTYDGMSIARAVMTYIAEKIGAFTLFATHYHELTDLPEEHGKIVNFTVAVKEGRDGVKFLRRIVPGKADRSYGVHVAELAGIPAEVIRTAEKILQELESKDPSAGVVTSAAAPGMEDLFATGIWDELAALDVMSLTPIEAMELLFRLNRDAKTRKGL